MAASVSPAHVAAAHELLPTLLILFRALHAELLEEDDEADDAETTVQQWNHARRVADGAVLLQLLHAIEPHKFVSHENETDADSNESDRARSTDARLQRLLSDLQRVFDELHTEPAASVTAHIQSSVIAVAAASVAPDDDAGSDGSGAFEVELVHLLELVLLYAIHSQRKEEVINAIMVSRQIKHSAACLRERPVKLSMRLTCPSVLSALSFLCSAVSL